MSKICDRKGINSGHVDLKGLRQLRRQSSQLTKTFEVETPQVYTLLRILFVKFTSINFKNIPNNIPFTSTTCLECSGAWALLA